MRAQTDVTPHNTSSAKLICPICGGDTFQDFRGRVLAQCKTCKSLERGRLLWLILTKTGTLRDGLDIIHIAPEMNILERLVQKSGKNYRAFDYQPDLYKNKFKRVERFDLCSDVSALPDESVDLIIHNHVLEHIPCDVFEVVNELNRVLRPGGQHYFSVPFRGATTDEDLSEDLSGEERKRRFAQEDHMRIFGKKDFPEHLVTRCGAWEAPFDVTSILTPEELVRHSIPSSVYNGVNGHSIFRFRKDEK